MKRFGLTKNEGIPEGLDTKKKVKREERFAKK
jgi:hypothetical protein